MTGTHWLILAGCFVSIGAMGSNIHHWGETMTPSFFFGVLGILGSNIAAALVKPKP
jgi:hypothetical protein